MEFTKRIEGNYVVLTGEGVEVYYFIRPTETRKSIKRYEATVDGYFFYEQDRYYKKKGRGGVKNKEEVFDKLRKADGYIVSKGYYFE